MEKQLNMGMKGFKIKDKPLKGQNIEDHGVFKPMKKVDRYNRSITYRKQKGVSLMGTNSEVY